MNTILVFDCKAQKRGWEGPAMFLNSLPMNLRVYNFLSATKSERFEKKQSIKNDKLSVCPFPNPGGLRTSRGMVLRVFSKAPLSPASASDVVSGLLSTSPPPSFSKSFCHRYFSTSAQKNAASKRHSRGARKPL